MFLIRFWRNRTKKDSVESAKYEIIIFLLYRGLSGTTLNFCTARNQTGAALARSKHLNHSQYPVVAAYF